VKKTSSQRGSVRTVSDADPASSLTATADLETAMRDLIGDHTHGTH